MQLRIILATLVTALSLTACGGDKAEKAAAMKEVAAKETAAKEAAAKEAGVTISGFVRLEVGEGIEVVKEDFAAEVAKAAKG